MSSKPTHQPFQPAARYRQRFLLPVFLLLAAVLLTVATINYFADPYRIFQHSAASESHFPYAQNQVHITKARGLVRATPRTVVLGNSRAEIGFNPDSLAWPENMLPVYNAAVPGSGPKTALQGLQQAIAGGQLRYALVGLDFFDYLSTAPSTADIGVGEPGSFGKHLTVAVDGKPYSAWQQGWQALQRNWQSLLSLTALRHSIMTLANRADVHSANIRANGFNPLNEYLAYFAKSGGQGLYNADYDKLTARLQRYKTAGYRLQTDDTMFSVVRAMQQAADAAEVQLQFYFYPYHADINQLINAAGLWPDYERWKRDVVSVVESSAGQPVWDFSATSVVTSAAPVAKGPVDRRDLLFWEPSHFAERLGNSMIAAMYKPDAGVRFGEPLALITLQQQLQRQRQIMQGYQSLQAQALAARLAQLQATAP